MSESWKSVAGSEVSVGDVIRTPSGVEMTVSRIETAFLGRPTLLAFFQDTPDRWFKAPVPADAEVQVRGA